MINPYFLIQEQPLGKVLELINAHEEVRAMLVEQEPITVRTGAGADTVPMPSSVTVPAKRLNAIQCDWPLDCADSIARLCGTSG